MFSIGKPDYSIGARTRTAMRLFADALHRRGRDREIQDGDTIEISMSGMALRLALQHILQNADRTNPHINALADAVKSVAD